MARKARVFLENISTNILIQGLDTQDIFYDDEDYEICLDIIKNQLSSSLHIHSYCLMKNQINIYCTPRTQEALPRFVQNFARLYARYYNKKYEKTGSLWQGRYKSSLVEDVAYMFDVMRYVEQLPLKIALVDFREYKYSSYLSNISKDSENPIISEHILYKSLGETKESRAKMYKSIASSTLLEDRFEFVDRCLKKQICTSSVGFCKNLEKMLGETLLEKQRGRPKEISKKGRSMYKKLVVLDKSLHNGLKIKDMKDLEFAKDLAFVPVVVNETALMAEDFPVVFSSDENSSLMALVSLGGSNLAIDDNFKWIKRYIPLHLKKYPFAIANVKDNPNQKIILIDEESYLVNKDEGVDIFSEDEQQSTLMTNAIEFLKHVDTQQMLTNSVTKLIEQSGILEDREISVGEGDEKRVLVKGFKIVNKERFHALSDDVLASWVRNGVVGFIEAHLKSLENIQTLFDLASQKQQM